MTYPLPAFHFLAEWGGARLGFTSIRGLNQETDVIEYREGSDRDPETRKIPGISRGDRITLVRGIISGDGELAQWMNTLRVGQVERRDLTISLLNADHEPEVVWRVRAAWPARLVGPELDAMAKTVAFEAIEVVHEGIRMESV